MPRLADSLALSIAYPYRLPTVISGTLVVIGSDLGPEVLSNGQKVRLRLYFPLRARRVSFFELSSFPLAVR